MGWREGAQGWPPPRQLRARTSTHHVLMARRYPVVRLLKACARDQDLLVQRLQLHAVAHLHLGCVRRCVCACVCVRIAPPPGVQQQGAVVVRGWWQCSGTAGLEAAPPNRAGMLGGLERHSPAPVAKAGAAVCLNITLCTPPPTLTLALPFFTVLLPSVRPINCSDSPN